MKTVSFTVPPSYGGASLKGFLRGWVGCSARLLTAAKRIEGGLLCNGEPATARTILQSGDRVSFSIAPSPCAVEPQRIPLSVAFEDESLLVVEKPSAMPVYPCPGHDRDSLANAVLGHLLAHGEALEFHPVYRLDRDTTGLVVLGKDSFAASCLAGKVEKEYIALCSGYLSGEGVEKGCIGLLPGHSIQRCVRPDGQRAVTRWKSLRAAADVSLLSFRLETGRTHQIRVHMAACGHPLLGDDLYGGPCDRIDRQALHCAVVRFLHPVKKNMLFFCSPLPEDMARILQSG